MDYFETIHTETLNGFDIVFSAAPETQAPDWDFQDEEDKADTLRRIHNGDLAWFVARVQAYKEGVLLAEDHLGGCLYDSCMQFVKDAYYSDMVMSVSNEARETIKRLSASVGEPA